MLQVKTRDGIGKIIAEEPMSAMVSGERLTVTLYRVEFPDGTSKAYFSWNIEWIKGDESEQSAGG